MSAARRLSHRAGVRRPIVGSVTSPLVSTRGPDVSFGDRAGSARNTFVIRDDGCVEMALTQGYTTIFDVADFDLVAAYRWYATVSRRASGKIYARAKVKSRSIWMHKVILGIGETSMGDHRDGRTLNNRRYNLRSATYAGNNANRRCRLAKSGYRGVTRVETGIGPRWNASVSYQGRNVYLGRFGDPISAALAYDRACLELHGEFGVLNFPEAPSTASGLLAGDPSLSTAVDHLPVLRSLPTSPHLLVPVAVLTMKHGGLTGCGQSQETVA